MSKHPSDEFQGAINDPKSCQVQKQSKTKVNSILEIMSNFFWTSGTSGPKRQPAVVEGASMIIPNLRLGARSQERQLKNYWLE